MVVARRAFGETFHHRDDKFGHPSERGMLLETGVMFQLHQHQVIGETAEANARACDPAINCDERHQKQPLCIKHGFCDDRQFAVT